MATLTLNIGTTKATAGKSDLVKWLLRKAERVGFQRAKYLPSDDGQHDIVVFSPSVWAELEHEDGTFRLHRQDDDGLRSSGWWYRADDATTELAACLADLKRQPVVQASKPDVPDNVPIAAAAPTAPKGKAKQAGARKVNGQGKAVRKPARRKADPKVAVVKFLTEKQLRESFYMKLFKAADPSQSALIPTMLADVAAVREKEAKVHDKQGRDADRDRCLHDAAACRGIAGLVLGEKHKPTRSRLQDIDDRGLARLVELADLLSGHATEPDEVTEVLAGIKPQILAAIDELVGPADDPEPSPPTKAKKAAKAPAEPAPKQPAAKVAPEKAEPQPKAKPAEAKLAPDEVKAFEPIRRPAQANPKPKAEAPAAYSHREEPNPDGPSELELGKVTRLDERVVKALRAAVDDAMHAVAGRFDLKYTVVKGQYTAESGVFRIALTTKDGSPITVHQSDAAPIVPPAAGEAPLPPAPETLPRRKADRKKLAVPNTVVPGRPTGKPLPPIPARPARPKLAAKLTESHDWIRLALADADGKKLSLTTSRNKESCSGTAPRDVMQSALKVFARFIEKAPGTAGEKMKRLAAAAAKVSSFQGLLAEMIAATSKAATLPPDAESVAIVNDLARRAAKARKAVAAK